MTKMTEKTEQQIREQFNWRLDSQRKVVAKMRANLVEEISAENSDLARVAKWNSESILQQAKLLQAYELVARDLESHSVEEVQMQLMWDVVKQSVYNDTSKEVVTERWARAKVLNECFCVNKFFSAYWEDKLMEIR